MALVFDVVKAKGKPDDNRRPGTSCPFCDVDGLENIIRRDGDRIWLQNKFRTLRHTLQTVLIESADHDADITTYEPEELHGVIRFALSCWEQMIDSGDYRSVLMYKNMGPLSGGSLTHPHMQIVGLEKEDGYAEISMKHFEGMPIVKALPRWEVSPYFVGYRLAQCNAETTLAHDAECLRELLDERA